MIRKLIIGSVTLLFLYGVGMYLMPLGFSLPSGWQGESREGVVFVDRNGEPMRRLLSDGLRIDEPARLEEFPESMILATLAAEDSRFYSHGGVDFIGIGRAVKDSISAKRFVSGASTVSQQLVKLSSPVRQRDIKTKVTESFVARKLEIFHGKEEILTAYLNRLPYGNQFTGTRAAARGYFGKPLGDLSLAESALLAGLPNKPTRLNPWRNLEAAKSRQEWVLKRMLDEKWISNSEYYAAVAEPLRLMENGAFEFQAPHFVDFVLQENPDVLAGNGKVKTTLDLALQRDVESTVATELSVLAKSSGEQNDLQAAVVVIENSTGDVLALSGSRSFAGSQAGQVNGAWVPRSAGSTLKPFTYLMGLEKGCHAASVLADTPIEYVTSTGAYQPVNFDRCFRGPVSLRRALANSMNVPAVKLLNEIGGPEVLHELMTKRLAFSSLNEKSTEYGLGLTLGNAEVRLLELSNAYACLARMESFVHISFSRDLTGLNR